MDEEEVYKEKSEGEDEKRQISRRKELKRMWRRRRRRTEKNSRMKSSVDHLWLCHFLVMR